MTEKRTQQVIDLRNNTEITTYPDGKVSARFELLNLEVLGADEDQARNILVEVLQEKVNGDDAARELFSQWAKDHIIEIELTDEDVAEEEAIESNAASASKGFRELGPDTFDAAIAGPKPVLVDFWAPWCQPCLRAAPVLKEIHDELAERFDVAKVNVEDYPMFSERFGVQGIPCFVLFQNGTEVDRVVGFAPKREFQAEIEQVLAKAT